MGIIYPAFKRALMLWARAELKQLRANDAGRFFPLSNGTWRPAPDGRYRKETVSLMYDFSAPAAADNEWASVLTVAEDTPDVIKHFDNLVGTAEATIRWEIKQVAYSLLPNAFLAQDGERIEYEDFKVFHERYAELEKFIANDEVVVTRVWPLQGLNLSGQTIALDSNAKLRPLTPAEQLRCLNYGIAGIDRAVNLVTPDQIVTSALELKLQLPKVIGVRDTDANATEALFAKIGTVVENAQAVFGLAGKNVRFNECLIVAGPRYDALTYSGIPIRTDVFLGLDQLSRSEAQRIKDWWNGIENQSRAGRALRLAAIRLYQANVRSGLNDKLLDIMIAAEALYLASESGQDNGELSYRLALRASVWSQRRTVRLDRKEVFSSIKTAYGARSKIAHGLLSGDSFTIRGTQLNLHQLVERSQLIIRAGVVRALGELAANPPRPFPPDWENAILGS